MTPTGEPRGTVTLRWSGRLSGAIETAWAILDISPRSEDRRCSTDLPRHERQTSDSADRRAEGYMPSAGNIQDHPSRLNKRRGRCDRGGEDRPARRGAGAGGTTGDPDAGGVQQGPPHPARATCRGRGRGGGAE